MGRVRVAAFSISIDGYGAGADQDAADPLGRRGLALHEWLFADSAKAGDEPSACPVNAGFIARANDHIGAWIMGRHMFAPSRGAWSDSSWRGWWGESPSFHLPVFVLTHHPRPSIEMTDGTVFHFVTDGLDVALHRARAAAADRDVRIGGGVSTVRQYVAAGCIDEIHLATVPILLGGGEALFPGIDLHASGFAVAEQACGRDVVHTVLVRDRR